jgi:hypothetical protein
MQSLQALLSLFPASTYVISYLTYSITAAPVWVWLHSQEVQSAQALLGLLPALSLAYAVRAWPPAAVAPALVDASLQDEAAALHISLHTCEER